MARSITILLVEDDPDDVLLMRLALEKILLGVPIFVVGNGAEAVEYLRGGGPYADRSAHPFPDVVLLDLMLPIMDGLEVLRWIRQQPEPELKHLPVVGLTGSMRDEDSKLACAAGANVCALKSQGFRRLAEIVMEVGGAPPMDAKRVDPPSTTPPGTASTTLGESSEIPGATTNGTVAGSDVSSLQKAPPSGGV